MVAKKKVDDEEDDKDDDGTEEEVYEEESEEGEGDEQGEESEENPRETEPVQDDPPKPQKVGNIDSLVFLKEYAKDVNRKYSNVATKLGISPTSAENYVKKYVYLVVNTQNDRDFPRRAKAVLNKNIPDRYHITDNEIIVLKPLVTTYGKFEIPVSNAQPYNQSDQGSSFGMSAGGNPFDPMNPGQPQPNTPSSVYMQKNQEYANLSTFSRSQILRWVLEKAPFIHFSKIEPFVALFETDEKNFMMNPENLYQTMVKYFGKENGDIAFNRFKAVVGNFLPPQAGFGNNPWYPDPNMQGMNPMGQGMGGMGGMPGGSMGGMSFYEAMGVIPYGMNPNSPDAKRFIIEFERKKRERQERREQQEEFNEQMKSLMNTKMLEIVDPRASQGNKGPANMDNLVAAGLARAIQGFDEKGNPVIKYEPTANQFGAGANGNQTQGGGNQIEWAKLIIETMNAVVSKSSEMPKFAETLLNTFITKMPIQMDPVQNLLQTKDVLDKISPQAGNFNMNLDIAKFNLAKARLDTDREFALRAADREHEKMMWERQRELEMEKSSSQNMSEIVKAIFSLGKDAFVPMLSFLTRGGMGGMGMPPGMAAQMAQQAAQAQAQGTPQPINRPSPSQGRQSAQQQYYDSDDMDQAARLQEQRFRERNQRRAPYGTSDLYGAQSTEGIAQQQQGQGQQAQAQGQETNEIRQYSVNDFEAWDLNTLENLKLKGQNSRASIDSFNSALSAAIAQKRLSVRQSPFDQVPQQQQGQQQGQTTTETTTTTTQTDFSTTQQMPPIQEDDERTNAELLKEAGPDEDSTGDIV